jgi:hypothetical protein
VYVTRRPNNEFGNPGQNQLPPEVATEAPVETVEKHDDAIFTSKFLAGCGGDHQQRLSGAEGFSLLRKFQRQPQYHGSGVEGAWRIISGGLAGVGVA